MKHGEDVQPFEQRIMAGEATVIVRRYAEPIEIAAQPIDEARLAECHRELTGYFCWLERRRAGINL